MLRATATILLCVLVCLVFLDHINAPVSSALMAMSAKEYNARGLEARYAQDPENAVQAFRKAIELDSDVASYHFNLATIYGNYPEKCAQVLQTDRIGLHKRVMDQSRRALFLEPRNLEYAESYAAHFFFAETDGVPIDWDQGLAAWKYYFSLKLDQISEVPNSRQAQIPFLLTLARIELKRHQKEQARDYLQKALAIAPDLKNAKKLLSKTE